MVDKIPSNIERMGVKLVKVLAAEIHLWHLLLDPTQKPTNQISGENVLPFHIRPCVSLILITVVSMKRTEKQQALAKIKETCSTGSTFNESHCKTT